MIFEVDTQLVSDIDEYYGKDATFLPNIYYHGKIEEDMGYDIANERRGKNNFQKAIEEFRHSGKNRRTIKTIANVKGTKRLVYVFLWHPKTPLDRVIGYVCYPEDEEAVKEAKKKQSKMVGIA